MTLRKPLTVVIGAIAALTMIAGCSSNGGGSGADFCELTKKADTIDENDLEAQAAMMKDLAAAAPAEIKDDMKFLADVFNKMAGIDMDDPAAMMEALGDDLTRMMEVSTSLPEKFAEICGE